MAVITITEDVRFQQVLVSAAIADIQAVFNSLPDATDGRQVKEILAQVLPDLFRTYGSEIAIQAASRFTEVRELSGVGGLFIPQKVDVVEEDRLLSSLGWALTPIFQETPDPDMALRNLVGMTDRYVLEPGRLTTAINVANPKSKSIGFARILGPGDTCAFCITMASKGPVYRSAKAAGEGNKYHDRCSCTAVPFFKDTEVEGYDVDDLQRKAKELAWEDTRKNRVRRPEFKR